MQIAVDQDSLVALIREIVSQTLAEIGWPIGRVALTELEAAESCGVGRHVLRDLRLAGQIEGTKLGKRVVYTRPQLIAGLAAMQLAAAGPKPKIAVERRSRHEEM